MTHQPGTSDHNYKPTSEHHDSTQQRTTSTHHHVTKTKNSDHCGPMHRDLTGLPRPANTNI
jgi:hypothetical protein